MAYELRDYQVDLINRIYQSLLQGHKHIIVQSPPRTGKTVVMSEIARRTTEKGNRVCFIIHRKEVLEQAKATFEAQGVNSDLLTAGMVQTLTRRVSKMKTPAVIMVDEAHHALAKSYTKIIEAFPNAIVLLFTATPVRTGRNQLDKIADDIVLGKTVKQLIDERFLAPFTYYGTKFKDVDTEKLKVSNGDYTNASMEEALGHKIYNHTVDEYLEKAKGMQAVVYTYNVESAKRLAEEFNARGISAAECDGATNKDVRDYIVKKFRDQKLKILVNVNLFTEGIDLPNVDCVIMVRPTQSLALFMQFSMRCLNPRPGKKAIIIDQVDNYKRHGLPTTDHDWKKLMTSGRKRKSPSMVSIVQCPSCMAAVERKEIKDNTCPICGYAPMQSQRDKEIEKADLAEISEDYLSDVTNRMQKAIKLAAKVEDWKQLKSYQQLLAYAKDHGYKKGWAWHKAKERGFI